MPKGNFVNRKGFTLIELLVVISIASMLSSLAMASVSVARVKAKNSRIIAQTNQIRNQIELGNNGNSYADFATFAAPLGAVGNVAIVAPFNFTSKVTELINDILSQNGGVYGGGKVGTYTDATCGTSDYYMASSNDPSGYALNGLTIFVYPDCGPVTKYAVYSMLSPIKVAINPIVNTAYAVAAIDTNPANYKGYYCVDSAGKSITKTDGWIPGYTGTNTTNIVTDGECH